MPVNSKQIFSCAQKPCLYSWVLASLFMCASIIAAPAMNASEQQYPDVLSVEVRQRGADVFDFDVTISSPYDTPRRYADAFRVTGAGGQVYGERKLLHHHANEQPFARDLYGVRIPTDVNRVRIQARDQQYGYGGKTAEVMLPGR